MADINITESGVYFDMDEETYHADASLSASGIKDLRVSPLTYWVKSPLNPNQVNKASQAMANGKALHTRVIEGPEAFAERYAVIPEKPEGALDGGAELKERCGELELKKSGSIAELCARIQEADPKAILWPDIIGEFNETNEGKIILKPEQAYDIEFPAQIIARHPTASKAFTGGFPEVSIFWRDEETGVPLKCRVDFLKTKAVVELKSFSNPFDKPLDVAIAHAIANRRYYVDAAVRLEGVEQAKKMIRAKKINNCPDDAWVKAFIECPGHTFVFVFLEQGDCPNIRVREFRRTVREGGDENLYWQTASTTFRWGVKLWNEHFKHFGAEVPWLNIEPMTPFSDEEFPMWMDG